LEIFVDGTYVTHYIGYLCSEAITDIEAIQLEFENFVLSLPRGKTPEQ
jgi:hypothetical protein